MASEYLVVERLGRRGERISTRVDFAAKPRQLVFDTDARARHHRLQRRDLIVQRTPLRIGVSVEGVGVVEQSASPRFELNP